MGRPKLSDENERKVATSTTLTKKDIVYLRKLGKGNMSEGIRKAVAMLKDIKKK